MDGLLDARYVSLAVSPPVVLAGAAGFALGVAATLLLLRRTPARPAEPTSSTPAFDPGAPSPPTDPEPPARTRESVGALAGGVVHDFHNLLTVILAHVDRAANRLPSSHEARAILGDVMAPVREAAGLTRALLRLTQDPTGELVPFDLVGLTRDSVRLLRRLLPASVTLNESFPEHPLWVEDDPMRVQRLLVDCVVQARDASPDAGAIRLELLHEPNGGAGEAVLRVADAEGRVDGRVARFPVGARSAQEQRPSAAEPPPPVGHGELVLVAEDDEFVREILITALEDGGYRVESAVDGPAALAIAARAGDELALAILDVDLPGRSGPGIRDELRARSPDLPILFVTGGGFSSETVPTGDDPVLEKPFSMERLLRVAHAILKDSVQKQQKPA